MRRLFVVFLALTATSAFAQSYPDVDALLDAFFAKDTKTLARFLPNQLQNSLTELPEAAQHDILESMMLANRAKQEGVTFERVDSWPALVLVHEHKKDKDVSSNDSDELVGRIELEKRISDGYESLLRLRAVDLKHKSADTEHISVLVWMRLEDEQWRITQVQPAMNENMLPNFDDPQFLDRMAAQHLSASEQVALATIRTYNTAFITYSSAYADVGFPHDLASLGGDPSACSAESAQHACLVDDKLSTPPFEKDGYRFTYQSGAENPVRHYTLMARPVEYGRNGKRSFYTDESGVIRATSEDRDPTPDDPSVP